MTIVNRQFVSFHKTTFEGYEDNHGNDFNRSVDWTTTHYSNCLYGYARFAGPFYQRWDPVFIPSESFELADGMDEICAFKADVNIAIEQLSGNFTDFDLYPGILRYPVAPNTWDRNLCSGRFYDGVNVYGATYPHLRWATGGSYPNIVIADLPKSYEVWFPPCSANTYQDILFRNGYDLWARNWAGDAWAAGKICKMSLVPELFLVQYLNPLVNSMSQYYASMGGGERIILYGMGFNNTLADIGGGWGPPGTCTDRTDKIYFRGLEGQGPYTLNYNAAPVAGQFSIDSNEQITMVLPAMLAGTYEIELHKQNVDCTGWPSAKQIYAYAGDWRCDTDGRARTGGRFAFLVTGNYLDPGGDPRARLTGGKMGGAGRGGSGGTGADGGGSGVMLLTDWQFENLIDEESVRYYSKLDTRAPTKFYEGRIMAAPTITRATDDMTGLPAVADMTIDLANHDLEMTKIMAQYLIVNRYVSLFAGFGNEPDAWREEILRCIVDDHEDMGPNWRFYLKDISKKYGTTKIPKYFITEAEYPLLHDDAKGKPMNDILGLHVLDSVNDKGACKAYCTDTVAFEYLASRGSLNSITAVYSAGVLKNTPADYTIVYKDGGRTYIDFVLTQGDNEVTFGCTGYMHAPWNDATGYVRNPAYVLAFLISLIAEVPIELLNMEAFDELATLFADLGWDQAGRLQVPLKGDDLNTLEEAIGELCFTFGIKQWFDRLGRYTVGKKTLCTLEADLIFFDEIDALSPAVRKPHQRQAVNYARVLWDYYPNADRYNGADEETKDSSIAALKAIREDSRAPWEFKWTDNEDVVADRIQELLMQRAYGYPRIYFSLPLVWFGSLDVFDNFWYQSHFGPSTTGEGEKQRLFYVESIGYDFDGNKMDIVGVDLSHLMAQCMIIGRCSEINANYLLAAPWMRAFGYIGRCTEGTFPNGDPNKLLCKCECDF